ncbi:MAG: acetyltransferase [Desulfurivibrionaceae bacterium]
MDHDVFNGDADGICALHQLRLAEPRQARLVSGVKRDINLLRKLISLPNCSNSRITVLDISMDKNRDDLKVLLNRENQIFYVDHHYPGDIPNAGNLETIIDPDPNVCTGLLIDRMLGGRYRLWAIVAAYGDNMHEAAIETAKSSNLTESQLQALRETGELLNYNGYGREVSDLHYPPEDLYREVSHYQDPLDLYQSSEVLDNLREGFKTDLERAGATPVLSESAAGRIFSFPDSPWSRRIAGIFSNDKARESPGQGHAVLVDNGDGSYLVSVRAPTANKKGAADLCRKFPSGGGREAAAGINGLPAARLDEFINDFHKMWQPTR